MLWVYIVLLVIGGLIGFLKAQSQVSLVMSVAFAVALSFCAAGIIFMPYVADILLAALLAVFTVRVVQTKKFMPAGMMLIITIIELALWHILPHEPLVQKSGTSLRTLALALPLVPM